MSEIEDFTLTIKSQWTFKTMPSLWNLRDQSFDFYTNFGVNGFIRFNLPPLDKAFVALRSPCCHERIFVQHNYPHLMLNPSAGEGLICCNRKCVRLLSSLADLSQNRLSTPEVYASDFWVGESLSLIEPIATKLLDPTIDPLSGPLVLTALLSRLEEFIYEERTSTGLLQRFTRRRIAKSLSGSLFA